MGIIIHSCQFSAGSFAAAGLSPHNRLADRSAVAAGHALCCELGCQALKAIRYRLHDNLNIAVSEFWFARHSPEFRMQKQQPASLPPSPYLIQTIICHGGPKIFDTTDEK